MSTKGLGEVLWDEAISKELVPPGATYSVHALAVLSSMHEGWNTELVDEVVSAVYGPRWLVVKLQEGGAVNQLDALRELARLRAEDWPFAKVLEAWQEARRDWVRRRAAVMAEILPEGVSAGSSMADRVIRPWEACFPAPIRPSAADASPLVVQMPEWRVQTPREEQEKWYGRVLVPHSSGSGLSSALFLTDHLTAYVDVQGLRGEWLLEQWREADSAYVRANRTRAHEEEEQRRAASLALEEQAEANMRAYLARARTEGGQS